MGDFSSHSCHYMTTPTLVQVLKRRRVKRPKTPTMRRVTMKKRRKRRVGKRKRNQTRRSRKNHPQQVKTLKWLREKRKMETTQMKNREATVCHQTPNYLPRGIFVVSFCVSCYIFI